MANKSKVYTKSGDKGQTSLVGGQRVNKSDHRIDLYGDVDELNSHIGVSASHIDLLGRYEAELDHLKEIQSLLFDLGSNLACEPAQRGEFKLPQIKISSIDKLEEQMDLLDAECPKLKSFVLPGGSPASASLHICRTVCRRVERKLVSFADREGEVEIPQNAAEFLNRLSDYFFVLSRYINVKEGRDEIMWIPQKS